MSAGLFGIVYGLVQGNSHGWTSTGVLSSFALGLVGLAAFVWWELRVAEPMLPLRLFKKRAFAAVNVTAMLFSFGMFGSIFFLSQFLQTVQGYSPLSAGLRVLPWTGVMMLLAPLVGALINRWGAKPLVVTGLMLQAAGLLWLALLINAGTPYVDMIAALRPGRRRDDPLLRPAGLARSGLGATALEGVASGTNSAFRELGGVLGIAVLGAVFSSSGGYTSGQAFVQRVHPGDPGRSGRGGPRDADRPRHPGRPPLPPGRAATEEGEEERDESELYLGRWPKVRPEAVGRD